MKSTTTPQELRGILVEAIRAAIDGRITTHTANAVAGLSAEVHKSMKMEYVGQIIANGNVSIENGRLVELLEQKK